MSSLDQPLLISQVGFHVGLQRSIRVAEERGFFKEEGLHDFVYDYRGLIPPAAERKYLGIAMEEHGVDIAVAPFIQTAIYQRSKGADLYVIGGWRKALRPKLFARKGISSLQELRGKRIGREGATRHPDDLVNNSLREAGIDLSEVEWVKLDRASYAYNDPRRKELLRSGEVDALTSNHSEARALMNEGYPVLVDGDTPERRRRPWRVIVATAQAIEKRPDDVRAFLRANLRGLWFFDDPDNFEAAHELETRIRQRYTHNEVERRLRINVEPWPLAESLNPLDGAVPPEGVSRIIGEMVKWGEIEEPIAVDDVLRHDLMTRAFDELCSRPSLQKEVAKIRKTIASL
jgi:ABC-type nitrate/sulfonate/bicarbonate transport system substrate-binding protein